MTLTLYAIVGPTAAGKGALARALAPRLGAELLLLDSMKVYRGLDVGTAKPGPAERAAVPHHLLDLADPRESFSVARYLAAAREAEAAVRARGRLPLYVGGTPLYLKALRHGLCPAPGADPVLRARLAHWPPERLHRLLARRDPAAARRIHPEDRKRAIRALEVVLATGQPLSARQTQFRRPGRPARLLGLRWERPVLRTRIRARLRRMLAAGWLEEVARLEREGAFGPTSGEAIGYRELRRYLQGACTLAEALAEAERRTWQLVRRQLTWFRSMPEIHWLDLTPERPLADVAEAALRFFAEGRAAAQRVGSSQS